MGRGKSINSLITGGANCAKIFLFKYAWIELDRQEVIFWNDFRWSSKLIPWETFLGLLEGEVVRFSLSKNLSSKNLTLPP